jgi:1-deoxy-D-xylulose-5-phosphate synthase
MGKAEVIDWGEDGAIIAFGSLMPACVKAAKRLRDEDGLNIGVINARFVKPLDRETILRAIEQLPVVVTVEEGTLEGGFGSAVLEAANSAGIDTRRVVRLGIPDRFIEHAERSELLSEIGLDINGICRAIRESRAEVGDDVRV